MTFNYPRPPIVEAVVEFRFAGVGAPKDFEAATKRLGRIYPRIEDVRQLQITIDGTSTQTSAENVGPLIRRMISADGTDVVMLQPDSVTAARLAPYPGWDHLTAKFRSALDLSRAVVRKRPLTRIGVRFINRIDVLADELGMVDHRDYLKLGAALLPVDDAPVLGLMFSVNSLLDRGRFGVVLNCGKVASPLLNHAGLLLDIEVYNQADLPTTEEGIWAQLDEIRVWKNRLFEASLTDKARELFN